ncbi:MAG: hypothetical protein ACI33S_04245 [Bacilli bacterium]
MKKILKWLLPVILLILVVLIIGYLIFIRNKLPEASISDFGKTELIIQNDISIEYYQKDLFNYIDIYYPYSNLNNKDKSIKVEQLSVEEKMSLLAYKLYINGTVTNTETLTQTDYINSIENEINYNGREYKKTFSAIKIDKFNELYKKEFKEDLNQIIDTFYIMNGGCNNVLVYYVKDLSLYIYYIDVSNNTKECSTIDGSLVGYLINDKELKLYEEINGKVVAEYVYEIEDDNYYFKGRYILEKANENVNRLEFGKSLINFDTYAHLAYIKESTKEENKSFNAGNNACLSIDWLVNNGYYENDSNLKGSVLIEYKDNKLYLKTWLNNGKYSIQSTGETLNKIVDKDIVTSTNCNGGTMKNVVYCDSSCKYIK